MNWTVKVWHFGQDALTSYSGQKFDMTWEDSLKCLSSYLFQRVWEKQDESKKRSSRISKQAIEGCIHGQIKI